MSHIHLRRFFVLLPLLGPLLIWGQNLPYQDMSFWRTEMIQAHKVTSIASYEFPFQPDSIVPDSLINTGIQQTLEEFDSLGRIIAKTNFFTFSDQQYAKRLLTYSDEGLVKSYFHYSQTELVRAELYHWENGLLDNWIITVNEPEMRTPKVFSKEIKRDINGTDRMILVKEGRKIVMADSLSHLQKPWGNVTLIKPVRGIKVRDSIVQYHPKGDTVFKKMIYHQGQLEYAETHWHYAGEFNKKVAEYQEGQFYRAYYRRFKDGRLIREKQIHQLPNLNFTKIYSYNHLGLPLKKEIYRNTELPISVVYYRIQNSIK